MSDVRGDRKFPTSILDRLVGDSEVRSTGGRSAQIQTLRQLRNSVRRDLQDLLNTRWRCTSWPPNLEELENSLVNYGIPDFTGASFDNRSSQRDFRKIVEHAIRRFEPRLGKVSVTFHRGDDPNDRTLRFRIDATLQVEDSTETVIYETLLDPTTSAFKVG